VTGIPHPRELLDLPTMQALGYAVGLTDGETFGALARMIAQHGERRAGGIWVSADGMRRLLSFAPDESGVLEIRESLAWSEGDE